jgi:hypothetical protein
MKTPTIGRIVHYLTFDDRTQPAMITEVNDNGTCALKIFQKIGIADMPAVPESTEPKRGHWNWPQQV